MIKSIRSVLISILLVSLLSCNAERKNKMSITKESFGTTTEGTPVDLFTLKNAHGMEVKITNYGCIIVSLMAPDRDGKNADVVLGFDNLDGYLKKHPYFGAVVGRYGNRIAKGKFTLDGVEYTLAQNNGENSSSWWSKGL